MRHLKKGRKFGRVTKQRKALMCNLAISLFDHGRISTTEAKAKELRPYVEKFITRAKNAGFVTSRLLASRLMNNKIIVKKLIEEIAPKYKEQEGGYTRITKSHNRGGDNAPIAIIELL
ncbi:MAG: large subunit ribosomal protein L17 [Flavobacteriaceae bacterium]|jgi:large subunit ribosomal protein L17